MKKILFSAFALLFLASPALADLYQWKDDTGVIHITDSMEKVPQEYRNQVRVFKEGAKEEAPPLDVESPPTLEEERQDLYGDQTLEWWRQNFQKKREELSNLQTSINTKTQFMEVYEGGKRFGQIFDNESNARYKIIKEELPEDLRKLAELREEYEDFQRSAIRAGVPKGIREP